MIIVFTNIQLDSEVFHIFCTTAYHMIQASMIKYWPLPRLQKVSDTKCLFFTWIIIVLIKRWVMLKSGESNILAIAIYLLLIYGFPKFIKHTVLPRFYVLSRFFFIVISLIIDGFVTLVMIFIVLMTNAVITIITSGISYYEKTSWQEPKDKEGLHVYNFWKPLLNIYSNSSG